MIEDLLRDGHIVKTAPDGGKAEKSVNLAVRKIEKAEEEFSAGIYDNALVSAYTAMFHSARALLFRDGFKERNHYALYEYIREAYRGKIETKYVNELNILRTIRHKVIYGDEDVNAKEVQEAEARDAIDMAAAFVESVKKML
jgi:uncharacterized protein (UPF0332 family)